MVVVVQEAGAGSLGVDVGAVYAGNAARVRRLVRGSVRAPEPVIEDACQTAWTRLVRDRGRVNADAAVAWLVTTAVREALRLTRRGAREVFLEELLDRAGELEELAAGPALEEVVECRARIASLQELPERQQRFIWLQAMGWTYREMAEQTGATPRTIDRQLIRARRRLASSER